jgi:dCTP deaminase
MRAVRGTFPSQLIEDLVRAGAIESEAPIRPEQIQPASLDLCVSLEGYSVPGSMLPLNGERVRDLAERYRRRRLDLENGETLVRGEVYLLRLRERASLPERVAGYANNKSSTGRIDLQTRLLCDSNPRYDKVPPGYKGELWLEIIPKSFDIVLRAGDSLDQIIFYEDRDILDAAELDRLQERVPLLFTPDGRPLHNTDSGALLMTLDLEQPIVGYRAKKSFDPIDLTMIAQHDPDEFFEPIAKPKAGALFLSREAFYIFSTYECVRVPPELAVEMLPYDTSAGEFRAHYAGFFDPGFGFGAAGEILGTPAVLEVRPYEDDLIVRHRQPVCKMAYERLVERPDKLYGVGLKSHYGEQRGPRLSKFFR